jgi:hypothetical protein
MLKIPPHMPHQITGCQGDRGFAKYARSTCMGVVGGFSFAVMVSRSMTAVGGARKGA